MKIYMQIYFKWCVFNKSYSYITINIAELYLMKSKL